MGSHFHIEFIDLNINCTVLPVSHDDHVVGGSPEGVDHGGVAGDHHDAGDDEGHDQLVPGEVDPAQDVRLLALNIPVYLSPKTLLTVIAVSDGLYVGAVGIMISEHILENVIRICQNVFHFHLCPDYRNSEED